jgi:hypothetical protein
MLPHFKLKFPINESGKGAQFMKMKPARKTPQQIRAATEELAKRHQANFRGWLDARKEAIDSQNTETIRHCSVAPDREIIR